MTREMATISQALEYPREPNKFRMSTQPMSLPVDRRAQQGGLLFLASLMMFFLSTIILYLLYAYWRRGELESTQVLPDSFLISTFSLIVVSGLLHVATQGIRRELRLRTVLCLFASLVAALVFMGVQASALEGILKDSQFTAAPHKGVVGMVMVLAFLHALHVLGGVICLGLVLIRAIQGRYDHERYWGMAFCTLYWHFLDVIWLCMLASFWSTSGGFDF